MRVELSPEAYAALNRDLIICPVQRSTQIGEIGIRHK